LTRRGQLFGTPQYLSPEQIRGKPLDGGADLFALGVIAYEMLASKRPWDGPKDDPRDVMMTILTQPPPRLTKVHETMAARLDAVNAFLRRALAKDRSDRPADAEAFFRELGVALFGESAVPEMPGAAVERRLDNVSSQSIELAIGTRPRRRDDATELDVSDETIPFQTEQRPERRNDTIQQPAFDSSKVIVDKASDIPIFVGEKLHSGWYVPPPVELEPADSTRATQPRTAQTARVPKRRSRAFGRFLFILIMIGLVAGAFWLGRNFR
jgi:serine/threonine protein kinase